MKNKVIWFGLSFLLVAAMLLASCATSTSTTTSTQTSTSTTTVTSTSPKTTTTTTKTTQLTTTSTASTGNWWDKLGKPTYGGEMTISLPQNITSFDCYNHPSTVTIQGAWQDYLTTDDWTLNPTVFAYQLNFRPSDYQVGCLGKDWEFTDPTTYVVHLRQGIHWQNIPPVNGREFTANDVAWHFHRMLGGGDGFTKPEPYYAAATVWQGLTSVTATDKYTVVFKFTGVNEESITELLQGGGSDQDFEAPEAVQLWGNLNDWHHAIGTGPFILQDFVSDSSATMVRNPNYFGYDERYPQNQLPYIDKLIVLIITDSATQLAGLRTGKIDVLDALTLQQAQAMKKTNPEILQLTYPSANTPSIDPRNDKAPFNDIRVRQALQMSLDLPTIASSYYAGTCPSVPSSMTSMYMTGWTYPYDQWPQSLKDSYAYNPTAAKQLLAAAGYPNGFKTNIVAATNTDLDLLQVAKSYFAAVGIDMEIRTMEFATWNSYVRAFKDDQMAYNNSCGFSFPPLMGFRRFQTGSGNNWCMVSDPAWDALYAKALVAPTTAEAMQYVVAGNKYLLPQHWLISLDTPNFFALYQPWLKGYNGQCFSISGSGTGPLFFGFYAARFWIDQNLKKNMGY